MDLYNQTTKYTCAASSLLMILNHFNKKFYLKKENEFRIWRETVNLPTRASSIYGLAVFAKKEGISVEIVLEESGYDYPDYRFKGYKKVEIESAEFMSSIFEKEVKNLAIPLVMKEIHVSDIKELLRKGKILMVRLNAGIFRDTKSNSQYLVFKGLTEQGKFIVFDPVSGILEVDEIQLKEALDTLHSKKKRDCRILIFS